MTKTLFRSALVAVLAISALTFGFGGVANAAPCATDRFGLWTQGQLRGSNVFMGRNPGGGPNGFGDGAFAQSDFDDLAAAGANYVQISHAGLYTEQAPYVVDQAAVNNLDNVLGMVEAAGLKAVIAFRSGPGRNEAAITNPPAAITTIWHSQAAQDAWAAMLRYTADRYGDDPNVVGLDVMVEPNVIDHHGYPSPQQFYQQYAGTLHDFNRLAGRATAAIRQVNSSVPILLEPEGWGGIPWLPYLHITGDSRTVYTVHDYTPQQYTFGQRAGAYPGNFDADFDGQDEYIDRAYLENVLEPVRTYGQDHDVPVAVTEFGVWRTATNAEDYLRDRIEIQDGIGSWAVWTWQPAGFDDPISMHDPGPEHDVLVDAWARNCGAFVRVRGGCIVIGLEPIDQLLRSLGLGPCLVNL